MKTVKISLSDADRKAISSQLGAKYSAETISFSLLSRAEALKAIMDGTNYQVTGLNDADVIGGMGLDRAVRILDGAEVEKDTVVPSPMVTKDNAKQYYDPKGGF